MQDLLFFLVLCVCLIYFWLFSKIFVFRMGKRRLFSALVNIINDNENLEEIVDQFSIVFKKFKEGNNTYTRSLSDVFEEFVYLLETRGEQLFTKYYLIGIDNNVDIRKKAYRLNTYYKSLQPFSSLSPKSQSYLQNLKTALVDNNIGLGETILGQLAEEIESKEKDLKNEERKNKIAFIVSLVGIILTVFFGIISFLKF